jgi:hypothetical protein
MMKRCFLILILQCLALTATVTPVQLGEGK